MRKWENEQSQIGHKKTSWSMESISSLFAKSWKKKDKSREAHLNLSSLESFSFRESKHLWTLLSLFAFYSTNIWFDA